jgi:CRISPR type III-A-associated RAMP protein Csm4
MTPSLIIKLRPTAPWRTGSGPAREKVDLVYHSDTLFSAVTLAMRQLGWLEEWLLATTAADEPAVRFTSCFPFVEDTLFVTPPRNLWPPPSSARVRWKSARFVPLPLVETLLRDPEARLREDDGWIVDAESECLLPLHGSRNLRPPLRLGTRRSVAVDRFTGAATLPSVAACLEFTTGCGLWLGVAFRSPESSQRWNPRVRACFRLLADSGFGGQRSRGWGRCESPEFVENGFPDLGLPVTPPAVNANGLEMAPESVPAGEQAYWLLSLYTPAPVDQVDWSRGAYALVTRVGRVDSSQRSGEIKRSLQMVSEGSVVFSGTPIRGTATDVAPAGFPHSVYRAGFAVAVPITWRVLA